MRRWMVFVCAGLSLLGAVPARGEGFTILDQLRQPRHAPSLFAELAARSYPADPAKSSLYNPWGERLLTLERIPADFGIRLVTAARVYEAQGIRFDGYMGSSDDGSHYYTAADGLDNAWYGDPENATYVLVQDGVVDDTRERVWVCPDYPVHALSLVGFPIRQAMTADYHEGALEYTFGGSFPANRPIDTRFFRRVHNLQRYFQRQQWYRNVYVATAEYRNPDYRPVSRFHVGDIVFMGHHGDPDDLGPWVAKHSGIVGTVDERGLPDIIYNMRVSRKMHDHYDGKINQWRTIEDEMVFFERFSDRYSLIGHGRIVYPFTRAVRTDPGQWMESLSSFLRKGFSLPAEHGP